MVTTDEGVYSIAPKLLSRIYSQEAYYRVTAESAKRIDVEGGWFEADTHYYEFDYKAAKEAARNAAARVWQFDWLRSSMRIPGWQMRHLRNELFLLESRARKNKAYTLNLSEQAHRASIKNIRSTTSKLEWGLKALQFTRDTSAEVFLVCAGFLSGGAAWAALGGGALAKGVFKYQDTENVGAATIDAATGLLVGLIGVGGKAATGGQKVAVFIMSEKTQAFGNFGSALVEGKTISEAAVSSATSAVVGIGAGHLVKSLEVSSLRSLSNQIGPIGIPVSTRLKTSVSGASVARLVGHHATKNASGIVSGQISDSISAAFMSSTLNSRQTTMRIPLGEPVLADIAVLGPDISSSPRRW